MACLFSPCFSLFCSSVGGKTPVVCEILMRVGSIVLFCTFNDSINVLIYMYIIKRPSILQDTTDLLHSRLTTVKNSILCRERVKV